MSSAARPHKLQNTTRPNIRSSAGHGLPESSIVQGWMTLPVIVGSGCRLNMQVATVSAEYPTSLPLRADPGCRPMIRRAQLPIIMLGGKPDLDRMKSLCQFWYTPKRMVPFRGIMCRLILSVTDSICHASWSDEGRPCRPGQTGAVITSQWVRLFNYVMALAFCSLSSFCD
jgi:hypothetical protein